jgi:hypothetical protein
MRVDTRSQLFSLLLASMLAACADDDPFIDSNAPLAELRFDLPEPLPPLEQPRVILLLDTSGSMQWRDGCVCETAACNECLPNCEMGERSRWYQVIEALTGSFSTFGCESTPRSAIEDFSYDHNYPIPSLVLTPDVQQRDDGLLYSFAPYVRFGTATFDSMPAYGSDALVPEQNFSWAKSRSAEGMSSYAGTAPGKPNKPRVRKDGSVVGRVNYPGSAGPFIIDTGIRSQGASEGALVLPEPDESNLQLQLRIHAQLFGVRPFGTSPVAAALDDLYFALRQHPLEGAAKTYVVLITDGLVDGDFRRFPTPGCDCSTFAECGEDPSDMSCPYPLSADAARHLRCGFDGGSCSGPLAKLYVVSTAAPQFPLQQQLDEIAAAGGSEAARFVSGVSGLYAALDEVLSRIVWDASQY